MVRATTECTFSTSQLSKVLRAWGVFYILPWKCDSRHNGVQLFISHLAKWLRTRRFSESTCRPSGATQIFGKTGWIATFLPFRAPASYFFWLFLFSLLLLFSDYSHLCFSICPYCRKFDFWTSFEFNLYIWYIYIYIYIMYMVIYIYIFIYIIII